MFDSQFFYNAMVAGPVILFSLTIHEFFHAWLADRFGDPTARNMGRVSLNPLVHLDFLGTMVMVLSGFRFGWAKPVPVNPYNLRNPRRDDIIISAGGPLSNIGLAVIFSLVYHLITAANIELNGALNDFFFFGIYINAILACFNLLPLFPLDGSHIMKNLLPPELEHRMEQFDRIAPFVLLILLITGLLWYIIGPPVSLLMSILGP